MPMATSRSSTLIPVTPGSSTTNATEYDYWDHVDWIISRAASKGIYIGLLPTWGDKVTAFRTEGVIFTSEARAHAYGQWLAQRYANSPNLI